jgi:hypothetical protein
MQPPCARFTSLTGFVVSWVVAWLLTLVPAAAGFVFTTNSSPDETAFDSLISATDLLAAGQASYSAATDTVAPDPGFTLDGTRDGAAASFVTDPEGAFSRNTYYSAAQTTLTFFFNTNTVTDGSAGGYIVTGVNVLAGWKDADYFQGQQWTFRVATLTNPTFTDVQSVVYHPPNGSKSSLVSITNTGSIIASGVTAVQFSIQKLSSWGVVFREIDVLGFPAPPTAAPPAPTGLTATASNGGSNVSVLLFWTKTPGAAGYHVWRSRTSGSGYQVVGSSFLPTYTDATVTNGTTYYYVVTATNSVGDSTYSFEASATPTAPLRIQCIGDGITSGYTDNPNWSVPFEFGYRSGLYLRMTTNGQPVQFVGTSPEPWTGAFGLPTNAPSPDLRSLGQDRHRGYASANTTFVLNNLNSWLATDDPDVILIVVGIDDVDMTVARSNLTNILQTIFTTKPRASTILAQITPKAFYSQFIVDYNTFIRDTLVPAFQAQGKRVSTVDQYANLLTNGAIDPALFSNGYNHPDNRAYDRMAQTWYDGIHAVLALPWRVTFTNAMAIEGNLVLAGAGGPPNAGFVMLTSTNPSLSVASWQPNYDIGSFDNFGNFAYTNALLPGLPMRFFRIKLP